MQSTAALHGICGGALGTHFWRLLVLCRSTDQLNRERKLQQSAAGSELRVLEDQYYSALRKNLEISAACQAVEDDMVLLQSRLDKLEKQQQQPPARALVNGQQGQQQFAENTAEGLEQEQAEETQQQPAALQNGAAAEDAQQ